MDATDARDFLELDDLPGVDAERFSEAFEEVLRAQLRAYGRIMLPRIGRGQRRHLPARQYKLAGQVFSAPRQTVWFFDAQTEADWLDIAVSYPLEDIDDWVILFRNEDIDDREARMLRPPLVPRLRKSLINRPWSIVDVCEKAEGNLEFTDFLSIIDCYPWIKLDHRTDSGFCTIETWNKRQRTSSLTLELDVQLQTNISPDYPASERPLLLKPGWTPPTEERHLTAVADVLDDIYASLRRLIRHNYKLDVDRLGPLLFWRDWPDELFEFDEREDGVLLDLPRQIGVLLDLPTETVATVLDRWIERCIKEPCCQLPFLGELNTTVLPDLELISYDDAHDPVEIPGGPLYFAIPDEPDDEPGKEQDDEQDDEQDKQA